MRSLTKEFTTADEATPITKPIARPMTPKVWRKSVNSLTNPFFFPVVFSILPMEGPFFNQVFILASKFLDFEHHPVGGRFRSYPPACVSHLPPSPHAFVTGPS